MLFDSQELWAPEDETGAATEPVVPTERALPEAPVEEIEPEVEPAGETIDDQVGSTVIDPNGQYSLSLNGAAENLTGAQYQYLAEAGYRALVQAQAQKQQEAEPMAEAPVPVAESAPDFDSQESMAAVHEKVQKIEQHLQQAQISQQQQTLESEAMSAINSSPTFKLISGLDDADKHIATVKNSIYRTALEKGVPVAEAAKEVESHYSALMQGPQKSYLEGKLREMGGAVEGSGGRRAPASKPMTGSDWKKDIPLQASIEMLQAANRS